MFYENEVCVMYHCISAERTAGLIIVTFLKFKNPKFDFVLAQWVSDMNCASIITM